VLAYRYASTLFVIVGMALVIGGGLVAIRGKSQDSQPRSSADRGSKSYLHQIFSVVVCCAAAAAAT
jgi:hypothetical protein